jgi:hypothetical protein
MQKISCIDNVSSIAKNGYKREQKYIIDTKTDSQINL